MGIPEETRQMTTFDCVLHKRVHIRSRYNLLEEFETMQRAIDVLPQHLIEAMNFIWCDSKCEACYEVGTYRKDLAKALGGALDVAFVAVQGGHNGINITAGAEGTLLR